MGSIDTIFCFTWTVSTMNYLQLKKNKRKDCANKKTKNKKTKKN